MDRDKTIVCDLDGVLTDGKQYITSDGSKLFKAFHSRDVAAIRELIFNGWRFVIVTADDDDSGKHFASKVGAEFLVLRDKSQIPFPYRIAIGDSAWDIPMLKKANMFICPSNADVEVRMHCTDPLDGDTPNWGGIILQTDGGCGIGSELIRILQ